MSIASWLRQTAYKASVTGTDGYGKPAYGAPVAVPVRVELDSRMVRNAQGEQVQSTHKLWSLTAISITDRVWLPNASTADANASKLPLAVNAVGDKAGARTLFEVWL